MAAIVKANPSLTSGGLAVLRRSFVTTDDGTMRYEADFCCLSSFATRWTPFFRTRAQPPTPLPAAMLQLQLTKTPELYDLTTETINGLTYFKASYSAGISTEVIITEDSDVRNFTVTINRDVGYVVSTPGTINGSTTFVKTGEETVTENYEYVSVTVSAESKNATLPLVKGRIELIKGALYLPYEYTATVIERSSKSRNSRGEYTFKASSTGVIADISRDGGRRTI
jgi:hypothetical protein